MSIINTPMYQVIARKWRPIIFEEVAGQDHVVKTLKNAISSKKIGHAYLFSGPRGVGKTTVARILARALNCGDTPTPTPCNVCDACKAILSGSAIDVLEIDGASYTQVENIRELTDGVKYAPTALRYKVYIIDEVHMLSTHSFNALLKTLEEPPSYVVFMFATTESHKIPLTILSRCQRFDFRRIPLKTIEAHLKDIAAKEGVKIDAESIYLITKESEGSLRDAQTLLEKVAAFSGKEVKFDAAIEALGCLDRTVVLDLLEAVVKKDPSACLNIVEKIHSFGYDLKKVVALLLENVRDLCVVKETGGKQAIELPESEMERLIHLSAEVELEGLQMLFSIFSGSYEDVARSDSPRFIFEMALLKAAHLDRIKPIGELIEKLERIKDSFRGALAKEGSDKTSGAPLYKVSETAGTNPCAQTVKTLDLPQTPFSGNPLGKGVGGRDLEPSVPGFLIYLKDTDLRLYKIIEPAAITLSEDLNRISIVGEDALQGILRVKKDAIEGAARDYFKRNIGVDIKKTDGVSGTPIEASDKDNALQGSAPAPASEDNVLKSAISTFGGKIIEERRKTR